MADKQQTKDLIAALLHERHGYEQRGDKAGIAEVDKELKRLGAEGQPPAKRATKRKPS